MAVAVRPWQDLEPGEKLRPVSEEITVEVGTPDVPAVVIITRREDGGLNAIVQGFINPDDMVHVLRGLADHLEANGPIDGGAVD